MVQVARAALRVVPAFVHSGFGQGVLAAALASAQEGLAVAQVHPLREALQVHLAH